MLLIVPGNLKLCGIITNIHIFPMPLVAQGIVETACTQQSLRPLRANVLVSIQEFHTGNQCPQSSLCSHEDVCCRVTPKGPEKGVTVTAVQSFWRITPLPAV